MYGLVNRAIQQLVVSHAGTTGWQRVCSRAGVEADGFIGMQAYDDGITYRLVGAASEILGQAPADVLRGFGEYWILYTAEEGYGELLQAAGTDLRSFLGNLDALHARVESVFPDMVLPRFSIHPHDDGSFDLHYRSERVGLAPMVEGLLAGLARRFGATVRIQHVQTRDEPAGFDVFHVQELQAGAAHPADAAAANPATLATTAAAAAAMNAAMASGASACPHAAMALKKQRPEGGPP